MKDDGSWIRVSLFCTHLNLSWRRLGIRLVQGLQFRCRARQRSNSRVLGQSLPYVRLPPFSLCIQAPAVFSAPSLNCEPADEVLQLLRCSAHFQSPRSWIFQLPRWAATHSRNRIGLPSPIAPQLGCPRRHPRCESSSLQQNTVPSVPI